MVFLFARFRFRPTIFCFYDLLDDNDVAAQTALYHAKYPGCVLLGVYRRQFLFASQAKHDFGVSRTGMDIYRLLAAAHNRYTPSIYTIT